MEILALDVLFKLPLAAQGQHVVFDCYVDVLLLHLRQFRLEYQLLFCLIDVARWVPCHERHCFFCRKKRLERGERILQKLHWVCFEETEWIERPKIPVSHWTHKSSRCHD